MNFSNWIAKNGFLLFFAVAFFSTWMVSGTVTKTGGLFFALLFGYAHLKNWDRRVQLMLLSLVIVIVIFLPLAIKGIANSDKIFSDVPVAIKIATQTLASGKNPYVENYYGTILDEATPYNIQFWERTGRPYLSLEHFAYMPTIFLASFPFEWAFPTVSYAWLALTILGICFILVYFLAPTQVEWIWCVLFLNPFTWTSALHMHSVDFLLLFFLLLFVMGWKKKNDWLMGISLGLALGTKIYVWIAAPFLVYYFISTRQKKVLGGLALSALFVHGPFLLWNTFAYLDDVVGLAVGSGTTSLTIWKEFYGLFPLLSRAGIISVEATSAVLLLMAIVFAYLFYRYTSKQRDLLATLAYSGLTTVCVFFVSKHFTNNYLTFPLFLGVIYLIGLTLSSSPKMERIFEGHAAKENSSYARWPPAR